MDGLKFNESGLIPVIIQDEETNQAFMLRYINKSALEKTQAGTDVWF